MQTILASNFPGVGLGTRDQIEYLEFNQRGGYHLHPAYVTEIAKQLDTP
jgi:hypothetical protein